MDQAIIKNDVQSIPGQYDAIIILHQEYQPLESKVWTFRHV